VGKDRKKGFPQEKILRGERVSEGGSQERKIAQEEKRGKGREIASKKNT